MTRLHDLSPPYSRSRRIRLMLCPYARKQPSIEIATQPQCAAIILSKFSLEKYWMLNRNTLNVFATPCYRVMLLTSSVWMASQMKPSTCTTWPRPFHWLPKLGFYNWSCKYTIRLLCSRVKVCSRSFWAKFELWTQHDKQVKSGSMIKHVHNVAQESMHFSGKLLLETMIEGNAL